MILNDETKVRRMQLVQRMLAFIDEYYKAFQKPTPMRLLAAKYSRAFMLLGGFPEVVSELSNEGSLKVFMLRSGAKVVYPHYYEENIVAIDAIKL